MGPMLAPDTAGNPSPCRHRCRATERFYSALLMHGSSVLAFSVDARGAKIQTKRSVNVSGGFFITWIVWEVGTNSSPGCLDH